MTATELTRLQHLLVQADNEIREAEEELGPDSREFAVYCSILLLKLRAKHIEEKETP